MNERKRQVLGKMERIYSRIRYLGGKRKLRKYERGGQRIQERISVRYGRHETARKRERNYQGGLQQRNYSGGQIRNTMRNTGED